MAAKKAKQNKQPKPAKKPVKAKASKTGKPRGAAPIELATPVTQLTPVMRPPAMPAPPTLHDNKSIYRRFVDEVLNAGQFDVAGQYLDDVVMSHNPFPGQTPGREGFEEVLRAFRDGFPDLHSKATHLVAEGDMVVGRFEVTGTHRGPFMGIPGTGNAIHYEEMAIVRFAGGKIVEHWSVADALAIMQQLQAPEA